MSIFKTLICLAIILAFTNCASPQKVPVDHNKEVAGILASKKAREFRGSGPLGTSNNPIKCDDFEGIREYLGKLKGERGEPVIITEIGNGGVGPFGGLLMIYNVIVDKVNPPPPFQIHFDYSFEGYTEKKAPAGLSLQE